MEATGSSASTYKDQEKALNSLLDTFGSAFSLDEIASAYCQANRNVDLAGEMLCQMQGSRSTDNEQACNDDIKSEAPLESSSYDNVSCQAKGNSRSSKTKYRPMSFGTVSGIIDRDYVGSRPSRNGLSNAVKPLKLESKVLSVSELPVEMVESNYGKGDHIRQDMEELLFKMLGEGFKLERDEIRKILETCQYDMQKSMAKLCDLSTEAFEKREKFAIKSYSQQLTDSFPSSEGGPSYRRNTNHFEGNGNRALNRNAELPYLKEKSEIERELLVALFTARTFEPFELPERTTKAEKKPRAFRHVVAATPDDSNLKRKTTSIDSEQHNKHGVADVDEDDSYEILRKAVKDYRGTMKEYYQAAVDAFAKGDQTRARKLLDQGQFFQKKAREADEDSGRAILKSKNLEAHDEVLLSVDDCSPKDAVHILKSHLSSLCGIPSKLKIIIETNEEDNSKGRRRRLIQKLLEKESIKWVEADAGTILIELKGMRSENLSFVK